MAGRHRKPPAWRRTLESLLRTRRKVRTAALRAEIVALRATVATLQEELARTREALAAAQVAAEVAQPTRVEASAPVIGPTLELPLVRLALSDVAVDRSPDTAFTEIVLQLSEAETASGMAGDSESGIESTAAAQATAVTETGPIMLDPEALLPAPAPVMREAVPAPVEDRLAWSVLAGLPERSLLDPREDRDADPVDHPIDRAADDTGRIVIRKTA